MRSLAKAPVRALYRTTAAFFWRHPDLIRKALAAPRGRRAIVALLSRLATRRVRFDQVLYAIIRQGTPSYFAALADAASSPAGAPESYGHLATRLHVMSLARRLDDVARELAAAEISPADPLLTEKRVEALREGEVEKAVGAEVVIADLDPPPSRRNFLTAAVAWLLDPAVGAAAKLFLRHAGLVKKTMRSSAGRYLIAMFMASRARNPTQFNWIYYAIIRHGTVDDFSAIADCARRLAKMHGGYGLLVTRLHFLNRAQRYQDALKEISKQPASIGDDSLVTPAKIDALFHEDRRAEVVEAISTTKVHPLDLSRHGTYLLAGVAAACQKRPDVVLDCFANQVGIMPPAIPGERAVANGEDVWREVADRTLALLSPLDRFDLGGAGRVGFFYHNMPHTLGHALHEPYFFLSMYRQQYDRIYLVGGLLEAYQPGPRACMEIVNQYCRYIPTDDGFFHNLAHFDLGHHRHGPLGFHAMHNWSLMREATFRTRDPADSFRLGDWTMKLPERFIELGMRFCRSHGIDPERPIVVFHVRSHDFHQINRQSLRNASVGDYAPALRWLLENGYQVVRLGDTRMPKLEFESRDYHELPFMSGYSAELDSFFVARARFMLTSPSGPLTYAWALGTPVLVANAILNYLHVNPGPEMHCFKVYVDSRTGRELSLKEAVERRLFLRIHEPELTREGFALRDASPEELLSSVRDMVEWLGKPDMPLTDRQRRFAQTADRMASELASDAALDPPIGDFIGFSLPNFRIAPSVAEARNDFADGPL